MSTRRILFVICAIYFIHPASAAPSQQRTTPSAAAANPYTKLTDQQLSGKATILVKDLRALNDEFKSSVSTMTPAADRKSKPEPPKIDNIQEKYDKVFAADARNVEQELLKRVPSSARPKGVRPDLASMLIKSGQMAGADPADAIASYIEELTAQLGKSAAKSQK